MAVEGEPYSLEEAQDEAFEMKQKIQAGEAESYSEANDIVDYERLSEKFGDESTAVAEYEEAKTSDASMRSFQAERNRYMEIVGKHYDKFLAEVGEIRGATANDFLASYKKLSIYESENPQDLDFGRRFWIDVVLDDPDISDAEREYIRNYMLSVMPVEVEPARYRENSSLPSEFIGNYPDQSKLLETITRLYKKIRKQKMLTNNVQGFTIAMTEIQQKLTDSDSINRFKTWAERVTAESGAYEELRDFPYDSGCAQNSTVNKTIDPIFAAIEKPEGWAKKTNQEWKDEFYAELQAEFGVDFRPPENL